MEQKSASLWMDNTRRGGFEPLRGDLTADAAILGAGITGLTAAILLAERGRSVIVLERNTIGSGETGKTTAHLTVAVDARYDALRRHLGAEGARLVAGASLAALAKIRELIEAHSIRCHFRPVPGYLYTERRSGVADLKREAAAAREAGLDVEWVTEVPLPFVTRGGVLFRDQAQFHPLEYLSGLARVAQSLGVRIFEHSQVREVRRGTPSVLGTAHGSVSATDVLQATNQAVFGFTEVHTKGSAWRTYALAYDASDDDREGLFWDDEDPYHYTRWQETDEGRFLIVGAEDHRTGAEEDTEERFRRLASWAESKFGKREIRRRWSGQIVEPHGGIPMIGGSKGMYVATGYAGQGMTFGTLGAMIVSDLVTGVENPWAEAFAPDRKLAHVMTKEFVTENAPFAAHLASDRLTSHNVEKGGPADVGPGEGRIVEIGGRKVALCRDDQGRLHSLSPVCTHLKCDVAWNTAERTWDCPCHGSRYAADGSVLNGPAHEPLRAISLERQRRDDEEWRRERDSNPR